MVSIFVISLNGCTKSSYQNPSVNTSQVVESINDDDLIQKLPKVKGVTIGEIKYIKAEVIPNRQLEAAILQQLPGYKFCSTVQSNNEGIRYFYNDVNLNEDDKLETVVYLLGAYSCGTGGCTTLIF